MDALCRKWNIQQLELFGSSLTDSFTEKSDIDLLVTFIDSESIGLKLFEVENDFSELFDRPVDLISKVSLLHSKNKLRRNEILNSATIIYEKA